MISIHPIAISFSSKFRNCNDISEIHDRLALDDEIRELLSYNTKNARNELLIKSGPLRVAFWSIYYGPDLVKISKDEKNIKIETLSIFNFWSAAVIGIILSLVFSFYISRQGNFVEVLSVWVAILSLGCFAMWVYHLAVVARIKKVARIGHTID
jgi:lipopolysaccharide export LptBFGC system permease protein LptF